MSLLDDVRRLDCLCDSRETPRHDATCVSLFLPRIVAVMEATEQVLLTLPDTSVFLGFGKDRHCRFCRETVYQGERWVGPHHKPDCPWPALVTALKGEEATA